MEILFLFSYPIPFPSKAFTFLAVTRRGASPGQHTVFLFVLAPGWGGGEACLPFSHIISKLHGLKLEAHPAAHTPADLHGGPLLGQFVEDIPWLKPQPFALLSAYPWGTRIPHTGVSLGLELQLYLCWGVTLASA